jgi:large subunit ribosomal protein L9
MVKYSKKRVVQHPHISHGVKVLLCEDVKKLGWLGDVVETSEGYARNYLLPSHKGVVATEANIRAIAREKAGRAEQRVQDRGRLEEAARAVQGAEAVIAARANEQGGLFGSIVPRQIAANLRAQGFEVADDFVWLSEHIKQVGTHEVTIKFAEDLVAKVSVVIVPEAAKGRSTPDIAGPSSLPLRRAGSATAGEGEPDGT